MEATVDAAQRSLLVTACVLSVVAIGVGACSSGGAGLTTGSMLSKPKPDDATERSLMVAATSARAARCGYNYDPARLRSAYIAHETSLGASRDVLGRLEKSYDYTRESVLKSTKQDEDYCSDARTADIKKELTRHLAGNFDLPPKKPEAPGGSWWGGSSSRVEPMDREKIFNPLPK